LILEFELFNIIAVGDKFKGGEYLVGSKISAKILQNSSTIQAKKTITFFIP
jgi:hypothetical protein